MTSDTGNAIMAMLRAGATTREICAALGCKRQLVHYYRRLRQSTPRARRISVVLPPELLERLNDHARRNGIAVDDAARALIAKAAGRK